MKASVVFSDDDGEFVDETDADDCDDCDDHLQVAGTQWWLEEVCTGASASRTEAFASSGLPTTPAEDLFGVKFSLKQAHTYEVDFKTGYQLNTYSNINILQLFINWGLCLEWIFLEASTHIKLIVEVGTTPYKEHSITLYLHSIKKTSVLRDGTSGKPWTSRGMWWTPGWE